MGFLCISVWHAHPLAKILDPPLDCVTVSMRKWNLKITSGIKDQIASVIRFTKLRHWGWALIIRASNEGVCGFWCNCECNMEWSEQEISSLKGLLKRELMSNRVHLIWYLKCIDYRKGKEKIYLDSMHMPFTMMPGGCKISRRSTNCLRSTF